MKTEQLKANTNMQMRVTKSKDDDDQIAGDKPGHSGARPQSDAGFFVSDKVSDEGCEGAYIGYVTEQGYAPNLLTADIRAQMY